jgi:hypothetical protein
MPDSTKTRDASTTMVAYVSSIYSLNGRNLLSLNVIRMPVADASAFTQQTRLTAIQQRNVNDVKYLTHLYVYVPSATGLVDFLPNYVTKSAQPLTRTPRGLPRVIKNFTGLRVPYLR